MGADKSAKNTPNVLKIVAPNCLFKPEIWDFDEKRLHWASVDRGGENHYNSSVAMWLSVAKGK